MGRADLKPAAAIYIAGAALCLRVTAPMFGWGAGPETGFGLMTLKKTTFFGYPLLEMLGRLSALVPTDAPEFSASIFAALAFGLVLVLLYDAVSAACGSRAGGLLAAVSFAMFPGALELFRSLTAGVWTLLLAAAITAAGVSFSKTSSRRSLMLLALLAGLGAFHHAFPPALAILAVILRYVGTGKKMEGAGYFAPAALLISVGVMALVFSAVRPPVYVNWDVKLASWLGYSEPMVNLVALLRQSIAPMEAPYRFYLIIQAIGTSYLPLLALGAVGTLLGRKKGGGAATFLWAAAALAVIAAAISPRANATFHITIALMFILAACSAGVVSLARAIKPAPGGAPSAAATLLCLVLVIFPIVINAGKLKSVVVSRERDYMHSLLMDMRRDAVLVYEAGADPLFGIEYLREVRGLRPDIILIRPEQIPKQGYREYIRREWPQYAVIPTEEHYMKFVEQLTSLVPQPGKSGKYVRKRLLEFLITRLLENVVLTNHLRQPVYLNRIDRLVESQFYAMMHFRTEGMMFYLRADPQVVDMDELGGLKELEFARDPDAARLLAAYLGGVAENFWSQQRYDPASALFEDCIALDAENVTCSFFMGMIYRAMGRYDEAVKGYYATIGLLGERRLRGEREMTDLLMYERLYMELNMPEKAKKYRGMTQPESAPALPPGLNQ